MKQIIISQPHISKDIVIKYFNVSGTYGAFDYSKERTLIQDDGEHVDESNGITEWKINDNGEKYACFKEDPANHGACIMLYH